MYRLCGLLLTLFLFVSGCADQSSKTLRIGTNVWAGYEPLYLGRELGYLDQNKVRLVEYTSASQVLQAFRQGLIEAAALTLDEVIKLQDTGEQVKIILVMDISNGADVMLGQPDIYTLEDLKDKKVGVEHTALGAYFINRIIEKSNLTKDSFTVVNLEVNQHEPAFLDKEVDAVITFEPTRSRLLENKANILFDSSQIPGEIVDVLIIKSEYVSQFESHIEHMKQAWYKSLEYFSTHPGKASRILDLRMKVGSENIMDAYAGLKLPDERHNTGLLYASPEPGLLAAAKQLQKVMKEHSIIEGSSDVSQLFEK